MAAPSLAPASAAAEPAASSYHVSGAWSQAGICTCIIVKQRNGSKRTAVAFDMGVCPPEVPFLRQLQLARNVHYIKTH
jgi:hypothetical protein